MNKDIIRKNLEAFAVGDAFGKATEYCSREEIATHYSNITTILPPEKSLSHKDVAYCHVTDDTEQIVYLIDEYAKKKRIDAHDTAITLLRWFRETDAMKYIGPSSLNALNSIENGGDIEKAGIHGTTCGGIMRSPSAIYFSSEETIERNIVECLKPTHNTSIAISAAISYGYAMLEASKDNATVDSIIEKAIYGAERGAGYGNSERVTGVGPNLVYRLPFLKKVIPSLKDDVSFKTFLYDILGTTLSSIDTSSAVFALLMYTNGDTMRTIRLATETGGDTDTIAALAGALVATYSKGHNIPQEMIDNVSKANNIDFETLSDKIITIQ